VAVKKKKKWKTGRLHLPGGHVHQDDGEGDIAARLTPLEELKEFEDSPQSEGHKGSTDDTIRVGSSSVRMPELSDEDRDAASTFKLNPTVLFLLVILLGFVAFIAWQITLMPPK
jgi:hypothetical protein